MPKPRTWLRRAARPAFEQLRAYMTWPLRADIAALAARLDAPAAEPAAEPAAASVLAPFDMNMTLHRSRGALLRGLPKGAQVFVSVGCAGRWFFDWIEQCYGDIPRHIGVEYYTPPPPDLPPNVEWIANTCSDMSALPDQSCDLVFSGQNLEHLWPDEALGFFLEAARITRPGGLLAMDSPNRTITEALRTWSHPEHTVELTTTEAIEVTELAGFDVTAMKGIWLCRDANTGAALPLLPSEDDPLSIEERMLAAVGQPDDAFIWWLEARRSERPPDAGGLRTRLDAIFALAWPERVARMAIGVGHPGADENWVDVAAGIPGAVIFGPSMPLRAGAYRVGFTLAAPIAGARTRCEVTLGPQADILVSSTVDLPQGDSVVTLDFTLPELQFGIQFRCLSLGAAAFSCRRGIALDEPPASFHFPPPRPTSAL